MFTPPSPIRMGSEVQQNNPRLVQVGIVLLDAFPSGCDAKIASGYSLKIHSW